MNFPKRIISIFLLFALLVGTSFAYDGYQNDPDMFPPCEHDKCKVEIHSDDGPACWIRDNEQHLHYIDTIGGDRHSIPNACWRSNIFHSDGYLVAYPAVGGVVFLRRPLAVDLQYLGLPHMHDTERSPDQDDDLATRMLQLGAQWWPNWDLHFRHSSRIYDGAFYDYHHPSKVYTAFPTTGGVWVANFTEDEPPYYRYERTHPSWLPYPPMRHHIKLQFTLTMDDKSKQLKDMGATFYNSVNEVPGLAKTIDEAITLFEPFKERLRNMEDHDYRKQYYRSLNPEEDEDTTDDQPEESDQPRWGIEWLFKQLY